MGRETDKDGTKEKRPREKVRAEWIRRKLREGSMGSQGNERLQEGRDGQQVNTSESEMRRPSVTLMPWRAVGSEGCRSQITLVEA